MSDVKGELVVFARGPDNKAYFNRHMSFYNSAGAWTGAAWHGWQATVRTAMADPVVLRVPPAPGSQAPNTLAVFIRDTGNNIFCTRFTDDVGTWDVLPTATATGKNLVFAAGENVVPVLNGDNRIDLFVRGADNAVWYASQIGSTSGHDQWSLWKSLGGNIQGKPEVIADNQGRLALFARDWQNSLWHKWQTSPGGTWSGGVNFSARMADSPVVAMNADGRLELFFVAQDEKVYRAVQDAPQGAWPPAIWSPLGGSVRPGLSVIRNVDGRLELVARGTDNKGYHIFQTTAGRDWSTWRPLGEGYLASAPSVAMNSDGRLEVFASAFTGTGPIKMQHAWWDSPTPTRWVGWKPL